MKSNLKQRIKKIHSFKTLNNFQPFRNLVNNRKKTKYKFKISQLRQIIYKNIKSNINLSINH